MKFLVKFLLHRITLIIIAIILQAVVLIGAIMFFHDSFEFFYAGSLLISSIAVLWIINNNKNPAYKIAWIIPILIFPVLGGLFYVFFGGNRMSGRMKRETQRIIDSLMEALPDNLNAGNEPEGFSENSLIQSRYIRNASSFPVYKNTKTYYYSIGEEAFESIVAELKKARRFIFLEFFIISEGIMWNTILDILVEKVKEGVDVRVIYDDFGCLMTLPYKYNEKLEQLGIKCRIFNRITPVLTLHHNTRDHRKIIVIDGHTAFTGGINLADEYINKKYRYGHWKDNAIMLKGDAVWSMTAMFLSMWGYLTKSNEDFNSFRNITYETHCGDECGLGFVQPYADSPLDDELVAPNISLTILSKAKKYVYITTPYLILTNELLTALKAAAKGGVDIRIITPHIPDKWYVHEVTKSYYRILIENGIKIYEYLPGFIHAKTVISDDEYGIVGSINLDYRSLFLQFECGVWLYRTKCIEDIKKDFLKTVSVSREITEEYFKNFRWYKTLLSSILRVFAPLM